jgi:hypothetical protein
MYRFKSGELAGKTMEHAILRSPHRLYPIAKWAEEEAEEKPRLRELVREFHRLRKVLRRARIHARCGQAGCSERARFMTFVRSESGYDPSPLLWCDKHGPGDPDFETDKMPVKLDAIGSFRTLNERRIFGRKFREALGIKEGTRITEAFAQQFFETLH